MTEIMFHENLTYIQQKKINENHNGNLCYLLFYVKD